MNTEIIRIKEIEFVRSKALQHLLTLVEHSLSDINEIKYVKAPCCNMVELYPALSPHQKDDIVDELRCYEQFKNVHHGKLAFVPVPIVFVTLSYPASPWLRWESNYSVYLGSNAKRWSDLYVQSCT